MKLLPIIGVEMRSFPLKQKLLLALTLISVVLMWNRLPLTDRESYFNFADTRSLFFIPNAGDVLSNIPFLIVGLWGLFLVSNFRSLLPEYKLGIRIIALGILLTCFGSMYFHLNPNRVTLFWDRLPMTIAFMGLVILLIVDRLSQKEGRRLSYPLLALGLVTILGWHFEVLSLRPYLVVQFGCLVFSMLTAIFTPSNLVKNKSIFLAIGLYILAKITEGFDLVIYQNLNFLVSGHTLKHLLAALALSCIFYPFHKSKDAKVNVL